MSTLGQKETFGECQVTARSRYWYLMIYIMQLLLSIIFFLALLISAEAAESGKCPPETGQFQWGMCIYQVKKLHKQEPFGQIEDTLIYEWHPPVTFSVQPRVTPKIYYTFRNISLIDLLYVIAQPEDDETKVVYDFETIKALIEKKYGPGKNVPGAKSLFQSQFEPRTRNTIYEIAMESPCGDFFEGSIRCSYWNTAGTTVVHVLLIGKDFDFYQYINYRPNTIRNKKDTHTDQGTKTPLYEKELSTLIFEPLF